jgi:hypothetical protein
VALEVLLPAGDNIRLEQLERPAIGSAAILSLQRHQGLACPAFGLLEFIGFGRGIAQMKRRAGIQSGIAAGVTVAEMGECRARCVLAVIELLVQAGPAPLDGGRERLVGSVPHLARDLPFHPGTTSRPPGDFFSARFREAMVVMRRAGKS